MIAKPSKKTIPIAIAMILLVALLGWLFGGDTVERKSGETPRDEDSSFRSRRPTDTRARGGLVYVLENLDS